MSSAPSVGLFWTKTLSLLTNGLLFLLVKIRVEWWIPDTIARCCPEGYMGTRFVWKDNQFVPIYEQEVRNLNIGKENSAN